MVKKLTVLVSTISNSQVFLRKNVSSFCKSFSHFFSKNISVYAVFDDQNFNDTLSNNTVSFEQLGPGFHLQWDLDPGPQYQKWETLTTRFPRCFICQS